MSRAMQTRCVARERRRAPAALRACLALWFVFYTVYTPIHLNLEPHSDEGAVCAPARLAAAAASVGQESHDGDEHHARHSAAQHKFKVTQPTRAIVAKMIPVQVVEWVDSYEGCPQPQVVEFSGLSPPELHCCWQFVFRAALPVRAPSLLS